MPTPDSTCWTVIRAAAAGSPADREELARRYLDVVRAYLATRWRRSPVLGELGDAVQEVFVECFRRGGALEAVAIAELWGVDAAALHHDYALARKEFRAALLEVVAFHSPGSPEALEREAADLLKALS
jgi:hypothetical protein